MSYQGYITIGKHWYELPSNGIDRHISSIDNILNLSGQQN